MGCVWHIRGYSSGAPLVESGPTRVTGRSNRKVQAADMDARVFRGWNQILNIVQVASGLLRRLGPEWISVEWVIRTIPILPSNALDLISRCVGERGVTRRCDRRPLRVLEIVARWRILSLGVFVSLARRESALWSRWSREDRRRRIRRGEYASSESEGPPESTSEPDTDEERPNFFVGGVRFTRVETARVLESVR